MSRTPLAECCAALMRLTLACGLAALGAAAQAQAPLPGELVINEIMYDPPQSPETNYEWVEIFNRSDRALDLATVRFGDASTAAPVPISTVARPIAPGEFVVIARSAAGVAEAFPGTVAITVAGFPALNNTGDRPRLLVGSVEIDAVAYVPAWGGRDRSLERIDPDGPGVQANFATSTDPRGATPGTVNAVFAPDTTPPDLDGVTVVDATTLEVTFTEPVSAATAAVASNYAVSGGIGAPLSAALLPGRTTARLALAAPLASPGAYTLTVRGIADDRGNVLAEASLPFFSGEGTPAGPRDLVVNEVWYDEPPAGNPGEYVELFNRTDRVFDLRDFTLNDNTGPDEPVTAEAAFVLPGGYAVVVRNRALFGARFGALAEGVPVIQQAAWSVLNNTGDSVVLRYRGVLVDSLAYTSAWGGRQAALERIDPDGPSRARTNWATSAAPLGGTPGGLNSVYAPDRTGPRLVSAVPSPDGQRLTVEADEPVDPASAQPSAFSVGAAAVTNVDVSDTGQTLWLELASRLPAGESTLTARGLRDALGNATPEQTVGVTFVPDVTPPGVVRAVALTATRVEVVFTEPVTAASASRPDAYSVSAGVGDAVSVEAVPGGGGVVRVVLVLGAPLPERVVLALTARGLEDLAGNVRPQDTAALFFGEPDVPAPGDLLITEIMYDPEGGSEGEYVELHNATSDRLFDLSRVVFEGTRPAVNMPTAVAPGAYVVLARSADAVRSHFPESRPVQATATFSLSNTGETLTLTVDGTVVEQVSYRPSWHRPELDRTRGIALERRSLAGPADAAASWSSSLDPLGGTPGRANSVSVAGPPVARGGLSVTSPFRPDDGEAARIAWALSVPGGTVRVRVYDGGGRLVREVAAAHLSGAEGFADWDGRDDRGERLRAGIYVVLVEVVDVEGARAEGYRAALVLGRR